MTDFDRSIIIRPPSRPLDHDVAAAIRSGLERCPDVAFAHLVDLEVPEAPEGASPALFVWLQPAAMRSLRMSLNLVSEIVADVLPEAVHLDVLILNSAPELLDRVEAAGCLFVERDADERRRALEAAAAPVGDARAAGSRRPWWPF
jgi:hypothetical protein